METETPLELLHEIPCHQCKAVREIILIDNGKTLLTCGYDSNVTVWRLDDLLLDLKAPPTVFQNIQIFRKNVKVRKIYYIEKFRLLIATGDEFAVKCFKRSKKGLFIKRNDIKFPFKSFAYGLSYLPSFGLLLIGFDKRIAIYKIKAHKIKMVGEIFLKKYKFEFVDNIVNDIVQYNERIVLIACEKAIFFLDVMRRTVLYGLNIHQSFVYRIQVTKDEGNGNFKFATCSEDKFLKIWKFESGSLILLNKLKFLEPVLFFQNVEDSMLIGLSSGVEGHGNLLLCDDQKLPPKHVEPKQPLVWGGSLCIKYLEDKRLIITGHWGGHIRIFRLRLNSE